MKKNIAIMFFLLAAVMVIFLILYPTIKVKYSHKAPVVTNFEQCSAAGYPILQSYPRQCTLPNGKFFVESFVPER